MFLTVEAISHCNKQAREAASSLSFCIVKSSENIFVENMLLSHRNTNQLKIEKKKTNPTNKPELKKGVEMDNSHCWSKEAALWRENIKLGTL